MVGVDEGCIVQYAAECVVLIAVVCHLWCGGIRPPWVVYHPEWGGSITRNRGDKTTHGRFIAHLGMVLFVICFI